MNLTSQELLSLFKNMCEFDRTLGFDLRVNESGHLEYDLEVQEQHTSRPGISHGGVLAGMMDAVLGITALEKAVSIGKLCSTVEFKINFLQPAKVGDLLRGNAKIDFVGKSLVVTSGEILSQPTFVAKGQGTFNLYDLDQENLKKYLP